MGATNGSAAAAVAEGGTGEGARMAEQLVDSAEEQVEQLEKRLG